MFFNTIQNLTHNIICTCQVIMYTSIPFIEPSAVIVSSPIDSAFVACPFVILNG